MGLTLPREFRVTKQPVELEHSFFVVFDSVYEELYFSLKPYIPIDKLSDKLSVVSSFSKSLCITGIYYEKINETLIL